MRHDSKKKIGRILQELNIYIVGDPGWNLVALVRTVRKLSW